MKNKTIIVILTIIIVALLGVVGVLAFKLYNGEKSESKPDEENKETATIKTEEKSEEREEVEERELTDNELEEINDYLENGKKLFLASEYERPEEISLYYQIEYCYDKDLKEEEMTTTELKGVGLDIDELEEIGIGYMKIKSEDLETYLNNNLNISIDDLEDIFMDYSEEYKLYYYMAPSDAYVLNINITSGKINKDGQYVIKYTDEYGYNWTATLEKNGNKYIFVSNINSAKEKIDKIKVMKDLKTGTVNYNINFDCKLHYKGTTLYYAELIWVNTEEKGDLAGKTDAYIYFDNNKCIANISVWNTEMYTQDYSSDKIYKLFLDFINE